MAYRKYPKIYLRRIVEALDVKWLLEEHYGLDRLRSIGDEVEALCPFHADVKPSFGMVQEGPLKGVWNCFACGGGDIFRFVSKKEVVGYWRAVEILAKQFKVKANQDMDRLARLAADAHPKTRAIKLEDEGCVLADQFISCDTPEVALAYLIGRRKFTERYARRLIELHEVGVTWYTDTLGRQHYCIGVHLLDPDGQRVSTYMEKLGDSKFKRYASGKGTVSRILFDLPGVQGRTVVLTEGLWDALKARSFGVPATCSFRNGLTLTQAEQIATRFDRLYIAYDNDDAGQEGAGKVMELLESFMDVRLVTLPEGKDPDDCKRSEFRGALVDSGWKF